MTNTLKTKIITTALITSLTTGVYAHSDNETLPPTQPADPRICEENAYAYIDNFALSLACFGKLMTTGSVSASIVPDPKPGVVYYFDDWGVGSDYQVPKQ